MKRIMCVVLAGTLFYAMLCGCTSKKDEGYVDDNGRTWEYCLELQGETNGKTSSFVVYTDDENLSFQQVWRCLISSDTRETENIPEFYFVG